MGKGKEGTARNRQKDGNREGTGYDGSNNYNGGIIDMKTISNLHPIVEHRIEMTVKMRQRMNWIQLAARATCRQWVHAVSDP